MSLNNNNLISDINNDKGIVLNNNDYGIVLNNNDPAAQEEHGQAHGGDAHGHVKKRKRRHRSHDPVGFSIPSTTQTAASPPPPTPTTTNQNTKKGRRKNYETEICNICQRKFNNFNELQYHKSEGHVPNSFKRYECERCDEEYLALIPN